MKIADIEKMLAGCSNQEERVRAMITAGFLELGRGNHKTVFDFDGRQVLKIVPHESGIRDRHVWGLISPENMVHYALTSFGDYWQVQEKGEPLKLGQCDVQSLARIAKRDGIKDIHFNNVMMFDGVLKIIDGRPIKWPL